MLKKIKRAKFLALTEEDEEMSLPLQVIYIIDGFYTYDTYRLIDG